MYKIHTSGATGSVNAIAQLRFMKAGVITSVMWAYSGIAAAGLDAAVALELSKSNISSIASNDTPNNVVSGISVGSNVASARFGANVCHDNIAWPVSVMDTIYLNLTAIGATAITSAVVDIYIAVMEK